MSMSTQGFQNPDNGPSYYKFSDSVLYRFNINNQRGLDGNPDLGGRLHFQHHAAARTIRFCPTWARSSRSTDPGIMLYQTYTVIVRNYDTGETHLLRPGRKRPSIVGRSAEPGPEGDS